MTPEERSHAHKLLDAAIDKTPVWIDGERRQVDVDISLVTDNGILSLGSRASKATFEPPFKWGLTEEEAIQAAKCNRRIWVRGRSPVDSYTIRGIEWRRENALLVQTDIGRVHRVDVALDRPPA